MSRIFELYRAAATASGSGEPAEEVYLVMSGLTSSQNLADANGKYFLVDKKKTGTERIWKHETQEYYIRNVYSQWCLVDSPTSTSYNVYIQDYNSNNYQAPWDEESDDSYVWYYQGSELPDVEFAPDIAGNSNFFYKEKTTSSDHSAVIPYDGVYVRQLQIPGTATPISYEDVGDSNPQMWIRHSPYDLDDVNKRSAVWKEDSAWKIGRLTLDASGAITSKEVRYSVPAGGEWPWKVFPAFADATLKIKKTKLTETPKIPQGLEVTAAPSDSLLVGKYTFRSIYGGHLFPQENDAFFEFDGTGKSFKVSKDYYGNLIWNLTGPEGYGYYQGDAEWFWPDAAKINMSYGGGAAEIEAIGTGTANIRILPQTSGTAPDFIEFGVYRRLESFIQNGYTIQFNYTSPAVPADAAPVNGVIRSGLKVWLKASEYDDFINNSLPSDGVSAFIIGSPKNNLNNENGIDFDPSGEADNSLAGQYGYETSCLYYGKVSRIAGGDGTLYIRLNKKAGKALSPQAFWPWEFGLYADENYKLNLVKTDLQADPPAPPVALYVSGFHERSNGYYANRVINNEYTPTNGDRWRICGLDDSQFRQVDSVWYNGSKQRWEMYCWTGDSHQYAYSSTTTEKWPDDADLLWYWGDRGYMSSNSLNDAGSIVGCSDEPISRYLTTKGLTLEDTSANYYFGQKLYSLRNSFNYEGQTPNLEDRFAIISTYDNAYRGSMEIRHDDSGYYWQIGKYVNNEYDSRLTKNVYCPPVATLEEMKWPWEVAEWACTHPGGGGGGVICAPLAFGVSDDDSITQAVGSYNSQTASGSAGYPGANSVWTCTTRDINVENLGTPTYYDRFISADGRAVIFLNADLGNINNGCRWIMRFPMYDDTGTTEDMYPRYRVAYQSASMDQRSPKWPWEVAWEAPNTNYFINPSPNFIKGNGATGGLYWGDRVFVKAKNSTDSYELPFLGGKQLPNVIYGQYAYAITVDGQNTPINPVFNGEFYLAPELLTWENFEGYDVAYRSKKDDKLGYYQPPDGGNSVAFGENGAFGAIVGKYNKADDNWTWTFLYFSFAGGGIDNMPKYQYTGDVPIGGEVWECVDWETIGVPGSVSVSKISSAKPQAAAAPNLVPKASDFWEGAVDGNTWSISWNSTTKRYEAAVLGASFESNTIGVDESGNPKLFPWELTEEQWGAEFAANVEIGIEGSRFEITGSDITGGYNEDYKRNTPANGLYFSRKFGGKFADPSLAGANDDTYYIRRQTGTASNELRAQGALKFVTEHEGGPQWRLATNPNSDKYVFALAQRSGDWRTPYADYASLKPPYDFENAFFSWYGNGYYGKIVPWPGYVIANGQRDYKTIPMFGARFTTNLKIDGVVDEIVDFVYDDSLEPLGDAPTANSRWKGTRNGASTVAAADTEPTYLWSWDVDQKRWNLEITDEDGYGSIDITSVSESSAEPSLFPWEYKAYEFSGWSPGIVTGRMIESFIWQGSRIVINGVAQYSGNGGHDVNGSYVSLYADPENYAYDSTNQNWCWFNKYGCRFGRWNNSSTGWALNSRDATFFSVYAANTDKLPWKDEDFSSDSSWTYGPSNFLVNGRPLDNPTGFTSAVDVINSDADLKGRYVLIGYNNLTENGLEELTYRKADDGAVLVRNNGQWSLYGSDGMARYVAADADSSHYPQDQSLTWTVAEASGGTESGLPLIVAVPGAAKVPKATLPVLTVADAGLAESNGVYSPSSEFGAWGTGAVWSSADGTYKLRCLVAGGTMSYVILTGDNLMTVKYVFMPSVNEDGTVENPYNDDGTSKAWAVYVGGTAPAPVVTATIVKDTLILSGASPDAINGTYELIDDTAEGDERIWSNGTYFVARGTSYTVWMVRSVDGRPSDPGSGNVYFYGSDTSKANPYNDDLTSYDWYSMYGSGTLSVAKG